MNIDCMHVYKHYYSFECRQKRGLELEKLGQREYVTV
jgi:hypothetical protein